MLPTTGITTTIVGNALGISSRDIGVLCTSDKVNMWSKYKPIRLAGLPDRSTNWWKATDGNCGFSIKQIPSYENLPEIMDGIMNGWEYQKPQGGSTSPYRIADFGGYDHAAGPFVSSFGGSSMIQVGSDASFSAMFNKGGSTSLLSVQDLDLVKECYFGVYIKKRGDSRYQRATSSVKIKDGGDIVTFTKNSLAIGYWDAYPFLSEEPITQLGQETINTYYTLPNVKSFEVNVVSSYFQVTLIANPLTPGDNTIKWKITLFNNAGGRTLTNNYIAFRYGDKKFNDPFVLGEIQNKLDDVYVGTMESVTLTGTERVDFEVLESPRGCTVWASFDSANILTSTNILPSRP